MDALLDLAVTLGILAIFRAFTGGRQALGILSAAAAIGFGLLAKGPVAALIVLMVIVPWLLWEWRAKGRLAWPAWGWWVAGILLTLVIVAPWIMAVTAREGPRALDELVGHYSVGRYLGTIENQSGPVWYYIPVLILGFFPWIAFLPPAIVAAWRTATSAPTESMPAHLARLSLVWALLPFLFFSFANTKLPNYIALEFPALALLVGLWFDRVAQGELRRAALIAATAVPLTIGAVAFAAGVFARDAHLVASARSVVPDAEMMAALLFIFSVATWVALLRRPTAGFAPYVLAVGAIAMLGYTATVAEPHAERFKPVPQLAAVIRAERQGGDAVAIQGVAGGNALLFYTAPHVYALDMPYETSRDGDNDPRHVICSARRTFVVTSRHRPSPDPTYGRERKLLARADNDVLYLYVDTGAPCATRVSALTF
ncbi:MAG: hypothetical protein JO101_11065 [Candidatus Eremiobacteraeota bacterium]|nr:hypothetical protein [Candidatus Eremiobacteraeota bacterium]MBV8355852.1 hypothetical protein [Candidatus Eremiobacteraeota bacterium]